MCLFRKRNTIQKAWTLFLWGPTYLTTTPLVVIFSWASSLFYDILNISYCISYQLSIHCVRLSFLYIVPVYNSYRCLSKGEKEAPKKLLRFWYCFRFCIIVGYPLWFRTSFGQYFFPSWIECIISILFSTSSTCLSLEIRFVFTIWLVHPYLAGYEYIYETVIEKWLKKYEEQIDELLKKMHDFVWRYYSIAFQYIMSKVQKNVTRVNEIVCKLLAN